MSFENTDWTLKDWAILKGAFCYLVTALVKNGGTSLTVATDVSERIRFDTPFDQYRIMSLNAVLITPYIEDRMTNVGYARVTAPDRI